jgi:hypothetical protein
MGANQMKERAVEIIAAYVRKNQVTQANSPRTRAYTSTLIA